MKAVLVLENGYHFYGEAINDNSDTVGEVVFNTAMTGYQETLTDPAYRGQIVVMTYPLIGNTGVNEEDSESPEVHPRGLVVKELAKNPSNFRTEQSLIDWLKMKGLVCIEGVDTRALTSIIRDHGTMRGVIGSVDCSVDDLVKKARNAPLIQEENLVDQVSTRVPYTYSSGNRGTLVVLDFGVRRSILNYFSQKGYNLRILPARSSIDTILNEQPHGVLLSNGPGDPHSVSYGIQLVQLLHRNVPMLGLGLGHLLISLALGGKVYKLKYGHRGVNQPVKDIINDKIHITSQNHSYAMSKEYLNEDILITHVNLDDNSVEGFRHRYLPLFGLQYDPVMSGPNKSDYLVDQFMDAVEKTI